jgi:hypothetical protein
VFVAGPRLWSDLYGAWIDDGLFVETLGSDDRRVLEAGLDALATDRHTLVVVHLGALDDAAHTGGPDGPRAIAAAKSYDAAVASVVRAAGPDTAVVSTSDHGLSSRGGHAGPERSVREVPVIAVGPGVPDRPLGALAQGEIAGVLSRAMGVGAPVPARARAPAAGWPKELPILALAIGLASFVRIAGGATSREGASRSPVWTLHLAVIATLVAAASISHLLALALALVALGRAAWRGTSDVSCLGAVLAGAGCAVGAIAASRRVLDAGGPFEALSGRSSSWVLTILAAFLLVVAAMIAERRHRTTGLAREVDAHRASSSARQGGERAARRWVWLGAAVPVLGGLLRFVHGETWSLSTLDVSAAFPLVDGPLGLPGALMVVVAQQALPELGLAAIAIAIAWRAGDDAIGAVVAGAAAVLSGAAAVASIVLLQAETQVVSALAVGGLARIATAVSTLFPGIAALLMLAGIRRRWAVSLRLPAGERTTALLILGTAALLWTTPARGATAADAAGPEPRSHVDAGAIAPAPAIDTAISLDLLDQSGKRVAVPSGAPGDVTLIALADRAGAGAMRDWADRLARRYGPHLRGETTPTLRVVPIAHLENVPRFARGLVRSSLRREDRDGTKPLSVALDWRGEAARQIGFLPGVPNLAVVDDTGSVIARALGPVSDPAAADSLFAVLDRLLGAPPGTPPHDVEAAAPAAREQEGQARSRSTAAANGTRAAEDAK